MTQKTGLSSREEFEQDLLDRARDPIFREQLLQNPKQVILNTFGFAIPSDIEVEFHVETANSIHLVLPMCEEDELTDAELEAVAGGDAWVYCGTNAPVCDINIGTTEGRK